MPNARVTVRSTDGEPLDPYIVFAPPLTDSNLIFAVLYLRERLPSLPILWPEHTP